MIEYVAGFAFDGGEVALVRKSRPHWQEGKLNGVGGKVEDGETPLNAMRREWEEEAGFAHSEWTHFCTLTDLDGWKVYFYRTELYSTWKTQANFQDTQTPATREDEPIDWYLYHEVLAGMFETIVNIPWLLVMANEYSMGHWPYAIVEGAG